MKFLLIALLSASVALAACEREPTTEAARGPKAERSFEAERDHYIEAMKRQLNELETEIDKTGRDTAKFTRKARREFEEELRKLRSELDGVDGKLEGVRDSAEESWSSARKEIDEAFRRLEKSYNDFVSKR